MSATVDHCRFLAVSYVLFFVSSVNAVAEDTNIRETRVAWNDFLLKNCAPGQPEHMVRKVMNGNFRDVGRARGNGENYRVLFLVDDFHQIEFAFDMKSRLVFTPTIQPRCRWLRMPGGYVESIPTLAEGQLKSKVEEVALRYIAGRTGRSRDSLSVYCQRGTEMGTWEVVVTINSLQVDTPNYLLEVTDNGVVTELRPIDAQRGAEKVPATNGTAACAVRT